MTTKKSKLKPLQVLKVADRKGFWLLDITYGGNHKHGAIALIEKSWGPKEVARALKRFIKRLNQLERLVAPTQPQKQNAKAKA